MPTMEQFETYMTKASEAATRALEARPLTRGTERATLDAALAAMWVKMAELEYTLVATDAFTRKTETYGRRLAAIEARLRIDQPPEVPSLNRIFGTEPDEPATAGV